MRVFCLLAGAFTMLAAGAEETPLREVLQHVEAFTATLTPEQREQVQVPFNDENRLTWSYFPGERRGLPWADMTDTQREAAQALLRSSLSKAGYEKAETIRALESVLREMEQSARRDPERYFLTVFGEPGLEAPWGLRYEGHHLSFNWTMAGGKVVASTPQFLGANPAEVRIENMRGVRALAAEEDLARTLVESLDEQQRALAVLNNTAPPEILTSNEREVAILEDLGVAFPQLNQEQQGLLLSLIEEYAHVQRPELAQDRLEKIRAAGIERVKFAWMGGLARGEGHYYRVQGPTFLIEYDNTQNNANHIHSVWRDFKGDFGRDVLKEHYQEFADAGNPHTHEH